MYEREPDVIIDCKDWKCFDFSLRETKMSHFPLDTPEKKRAFCFKNRDHIQTIDYKSENDICILQRSGVPNPDKKNVKNLYCQETYGWNAVYSYVRDDCLKKSDIFLYDANFRSSSENTISKYNHFTQLLDTKNDWIPKKYQQKLTPIFKKLNNYFETVPKKEAEKVAKNLIVFIENKIQNTQNAIIKNILFLLRYEIENLYLRKIYGCKGSFCDLRRVVFWGDGYRKILKLKDGIVLYLEDMHWAETFGCYGGKTILKKDGREKIIIDDEKAKLSEYRALCAVDAQVVDDDTVRLFVCIADGAWSGDCSSLVFDLDLDSEKLSFVGNWYKTYEDNFNLLVLDYQEKEYKNHLPETLGDISEHLDLGKKPPTQLTREELGSFFREVDYIEKIRERNQKIRDYFKLSHHLEIESIKGDDFVKLLDSYKRDKNFESLYEVKTHKSVVDCRDAENPLAQCEINFLKQ